MTGKKEDTKAIQPSSGGQVLSEIAKVISDKSYPPVHLWEPDFCGDMNLRIARDGTWFYMDTPIARPEMVRLFSTVLRKDGDNYFLVTPVEKLGIKVDDAPFHIAHMQRFGEGRTQSISFETTTDDKVIAGADNPIRVATNPETGEPSPYVTVRGGMEGLLSRAVYYELISLAEPSAEDGNVFGVWSEGEFFPLGKLEGDTRD